MSLRFRCWDLFADVPIVVGLSRCRFVVDDEHAEPIAKELHSLYSRTVNSPKTFGRTWSSLALADQKSMRKYTTNNPPLL